MFGNTYSDIADSEWADSGADGVDGGASIEPGGKTKLSLFFGVMFFRERNFYSL